MTDTERRSEQRYVVEGLYAKIGEAHYEIVDISGGAVRLLTVAEDIDLEGEIPVQIVRIDSKGEVVFESTFTFIRGDHRSVVLMFDNRDPEFEIVLEKANTFQVADFDESLFDYDFEIGDQDADG